MHVSYQYRCTQTCLFFFHKQQIIYNMEGKMTTPIYAEPSDVTHLVSVIVGTKNRGFSYRGKRKKKVESTQWKHLKTYKRCSTVQCPEIVNVYEWKRWSWHYVNRRCMGVSYMYSLDPGEFEGTEEHFYWHEELLVCIFNFRFCELEVPSYWLLCTLQWHALYAVQYPSNLHLNALYQRAVYVWSWFLKGTHFIILLL